MIQETNHKIRQKDNSGMSERDRRTITLAEDIIDRIERRASDNRQFSMILERDLRRYYMLIEIAEEELGDVFSEAELKKLAKAADFLDQKEVIRTAPLHTLRVFFQSASLDKELNVKIKKLSNEAFIALVDQLEIARNNGTKKGN